MRKYRKKAIEVEALQFNGDNIDEVLDFVNHGSRLAKPIYEGNTVKGIAIDTLEGEHLASINDFIIKGIKGEFYPCKPDIFAKSYESVR